MGQIKNEVILIDSTTNVLKNISKATSATEKTFKKLATTSNWLNKSLSLSNLSGLTRGLISNRTVVSNLATAYNMLGQSIRRINSVGNNGRASAISAENRLLTFQANKLREIARLSNNLNTNINWNRNRNVAGVYPDRRNNYYKSINNSVGRVNLYGLLNRKISRVNLNNLLRNKIAPINLNGAVRSKITPITTPITAPTPVPNLQSQIPKISMANPVAMPVVRVRTLFGGLNQGLDTVDNRFSRFTGTLGRVGSNLLYLRRLFDLFRDSIVNIYNVFKSIMDKIDSQVRDFYRLRLVSGDPLKFQRQIYESSLRSRASSADVTSLVSKLLLNAPNAFVKKNGTLDTNKALNVSETFYKMGKLSGATTQETASASLQFKQALASNRLQGDEFRSINENMPMMMNYIVKYLNKTKQYGDVTRGSLLKLRKEGKLTAEVMVNSMLNASKEINEQFKNMPKSFSEVCQEINSRFTQSMLPIGQSISKMFNSPGVSKLTAGFGEGFDILAKKLQDAMMILSQSNGGQFISWAINRVKELGNYVGNVAISIAKWARYIATNWDTIGPSIRRVLKNVWTLTQGIWGLISPTLQMVGAILQNKTAVEVLNGLLKILGFILLGKIIAGFIGLFTPLWSIINGFRVFSSILSSTISAGGGVCNIINSIANSAGSAVGSVISLATALGRVIAVAGGVGIAVGAVGGAIALVNNKIQTNKSAKMNEAQAGKALGRDIKKTSYKSAFSPAGAKSNYAVVNSFIKNNGVSKIHDMKKSRTFLTELKQKYIKGGNRNLIKYTQQELNKARANYAAGYTNQRYMQIMAAAGMNRHYHNKVLNHQKEQEAKFKLNMPKFEVPKIAPITGAGAGAGGKVPKAKKGKSLGSSKSNPVHAIVDKPIELDEKYRDIMFGVAEMKWVNRYATAPEGSGVVVNITGDHYHSDESDHKTFVKNITKEMSAHRAGRLGGAY